MRLKNVLLVVRDIERSKVFYRNLFGLEVIRDFGSNVILTEGLVLQEQEEWEKVMERPVVSGGNDAELYFEEHDIGAFIKKMEQNASMIVYVHEMIERDQGQRVIRIYDPDQHVIEIGESMESVVRRSCGETYVFKQAREEELSDILALYRAAVGTAGCTWSLDYPNADILKDDFQRGNLFCMKNQEQEILGVISIDVDEAVAALPCWTRELRPAAELARLAVKEAYQNRGIARLLLKAAMKELMHRGYRGVHFLVSKTNEKAIRSYGRLEFAVRGDCNLYDTDWWCYEKEFDHNRMERDEDAV